MILIPASVSSDVLGPNSNTVSAEDTSVTSLGGCCVAHPANKLKPKPIANTFKTNRFTGDSNEVNIVKSPRVNCIVVNIRQSLLLNIQQSIVVT